MKKTSLSLLVLALLAVSCNLPGNEETPTQVSPDAVYTHAAETMSAELTRVALLATSTPTKTIPTETYTPTITNTPVYTSTNTQIPCLMVGYDDATIDVTYPDNAPVSPGQAFTKIWRLTNTGSCSWNSAYQLVFDHGDPMGVSTTYSQPLTPGTVAPGQTVDIAVNLVAPMTPGTYTGYWRFRDPNNVYFGIEGTSAWIVKVKVISSTAINLLPVVGESGTIRSDGGPWPDYTAGESNADITKTAQAFLSYDISSIPANATITEVKINFSNYTTTGTPFNLGVLNGYVMNYGPTLEPADFVVGFPAGNTIDWGSLTALNNIEVSPELKAALQAKLGTTRLQIRLQFPGSNMDAVKDRITFTNPSLAVTYTTP